MLTFLELAYMFDATQDYGLGCGEWCWRSLNLLTYLMLRKIMGSVWDVGINVGCPYVFSTFFLCPPCCFWRLTQRRWKNDPKKTACRCGLRNRKRKTHCKFHKIKLKYWKIHGILTCAKKRNPTKYCKGSQNEENAFKKMHGIHGAANSGVTLLLSIWSCHRRKANSRCLLLSSLSVTVMYTHRITRFWLVLIMTVASNWTSFGAIFFYKTLNCETKTKRSHKQTFLSQ